MLSQAVSYITIHLRNAFTQNSRQRILGGLPEQTLPIADVCYAEESLLSQAVSCVTFYLRNILIIRLLRIICGLPELLKFRTNRCLHLLCRGSLLTKCIASVTFYLRNILIIRLQQIIRSLPELLKFRTNTERSGRQI